VRQVEARNLQEPVKIFPVWEGFQNTTSNLVPRRIKMNAGIEADKAARNSATAIASAYSLSINEVMLLNRNNNIPGLDRSLKHKQRLRRLPYESRDSAC
jgi:hypothetical protein